MLDWTQNALVLFLLVLPVLVFFAWVVKQQQLHGVTYVLADTRLLLRTAQVIPHRHSHALGL